MKLTENSLRVLEARYLLRDETGQVVETPTELFQRVANFVASAERTESNRTRFASVFYKAMTELEWLPSSPILMNAGVPRMGALAACYVLPVEDDLSDIFQRVKDAAEITKQGGGIGYSFSRLRPSTDRVASSGGQASGPISFLQNFDVAAQTVKQGGRRRAAQMGVLRVDHPDILAFIDLKAKDNRTLANFNLSVGLTDSFLHALRADVDDHYNLINPRTGDTVGSISARAVWRRLAERAWVGGDPGIVFLDRANEAHANPHLGIIETPNACSESFMLPWETCILGSVNLVNAYHSGDPSLKKLRQACATLTRFLDNVIDVSQYPHPQIYHQTQNTRRIGVGVMGLADVLIREGVAYDSPAGVELTRTLMKAVQSFVHQESEQLAEERGTYPAWHRSKNTRPMRNTDPVVIAPTGTISIIAGVSSGIEPLFATHYARNVLDGQRLVETHPAVGHAHPSLLKTAHEIAPADHLAIQAVVQEYTDNAVSKTINLPAEATVDDVEHIYNEAVRLNLRAVSIYRDKSKDAQVLDTIEVALLDELCPCCAEYLIHIEGCKRCPSTVCGWSACDI